MKTTAKHTPGPCGCKFPGRFRETWEPCPLHREAPMLLTDLRSLITAAEIIDGQESPDTSDVDFLLATIRKARTTIARTEGRNT